MEDQFLRFENYILGNLSLKEQEDFELQLQKDDDLKQHFNAYKETHDFLAHKFENEAAKNNFEKNISKISSTYFEQKQPNKNKFWYLGVAASIALLVGLFLWNPNNPSYDEFVTYPTLDFTERSTNTSLLKDTEELFNHKDFEKANTNFTTLLQNEPNNTEFKMYKGFSLMALNRFEEATVLLQEIADGNSGYKHKAIWYLALNKLKQKDLKACKALLEKIPEEVVFYDDVRKLYKQLD